MAGGIRKKSEIAQGNSLTTDILCSIVLMEVIL